MNDAKVLKKIGKLLSVYGVSDEEKEKFLADVQDTKYDEPDEEEVVEEPKTQEEENPQEVETMEGEAGGEEPKVEEPAAEEPKVEETPNDAETPEAEQPVEEGAEQPVEPEQTMFDAQAKYEEVLKANEGLTARLMALEDALTKAGILVGSPTQPVGVENTDTQTAQNVNNGLQDILSKLNK